MYRLEKHKPEGEPWNKGKLMDQELSLTLQEIWPIRIRLQNAGRYNFSWAMQNWTVRSGTWVSKSMMR